MTFLTCDEPRALQRGDWARLTFLDEGGSSATLPYATGFLRKFEEDQCYDRYWDPDESKHDWMTTRYTCCGYHFLVAGRHGAKFVTEADSGLPFHFRHQYYQLGLFVHMQHASLVRFLDDLYGATQRRKRMDEAVQRVQHAFVRFTAGLWFTEVTPQLQGQELYARWLKQMGTDRLYEEVKAELSLAHEYLAGVRALKLSQGSIMLAWAAMFFLPIAIMVNVFAVDTWRKALSVFAQKMMPWCTEPWREVLVVVVPAVFIALIVLAFVKCRQRRLR